MINTLVANLPEVYQPIYGHPELSGQVSRSSQDRLDHILRIHNAVRDLLGRPLKVLDLGCAQGYFSLNLAARGAVVHGVDYLDKNVALCQALAKENPALQISFETARIETIIGHLQPGAYDLVLGLSVFHHVIHEKGIPVVQALLAHAANQCGVLLLELALREAPIYWASSQPEDPCELLASIAFVHQVSSHSTHLTDIKRPLLVASNRYWVTESAADAFDVWTHESHQMANNTHEGSRRYFIGPKSLFKQYFLKHSRGNHNKNEQNREVAFLQAPPPEFPAAHLLTHGQHETEAWIAMERLPGKLLLDLLQAGVPMDTRAVLLAVLKQLSTLEAAGLYHDDVRTWNVLVAENGTAHLIDYGSISAIPKDCAWPGNPYLAFFIFVREIATGVIDDPTMLRTIAISPLRLPAPYQAWAASLWRRPPSEWSFGLMYQSLLNSSLGDSEFLPPLAECGADRLWMSAIEEAIQTQNSFDHHTKTALHALHTAYGNLQSDSARTAAAGQHASSIAEQAVGTAQHASSIAEQAVGTAQHASSIAKQAVGTAQHASSIAEQASMSVGHLEAQLEQVWAALHQAQQQIASLHEHQRIEHEVLQALLSSKSWRLTAPARFIGHLARRSLKLASRSFRAAVRPVLLTSARFVINRPNLRQRLSRLLQPFPTLSRHLHLFAINRGLLDHPSAESHAVSAFPPPTRHPLQDAAKALKDPILAGLPRPVQLDTLLNADSLARDAVQHEPVESLPKFRQDGTPLCFVLVILDGNSASIAKSIQSCLRQTAPHWELVFLVGPEHASLIDPWLDTDWRFRRCICTESDLGLRLIQALEACTADFAGWIFEGDEADDDLVKAVSKRLAQETDVDIVYTDALRHDGPQITAILKPDWSPILQHSLNMLAFFSAVRKSILLGMPPWSTSSWTAAYFGVLSEAARQARKVSHIREALYHCWSPNRAHVDIRFDSHSARDVQQGLQSFHDRTNAGYQVGIDPKTHAPIAKPPVPPDVEVTLVILTGLSRRDLPGRGNILLVDNCVRSIVENTSFPNYRLIVVDDGDLPESLRAYLKLHGHEAISYTKDGLFSFAKKSNFATSLAKSGIVVLLNDDLEVIAPDWLDWMVGYATDPRVGIVGAKLLYSDNTLQHAGIVMGMNGACGHVFDRHPDDGTEYLGLASHDRNCTAVTGAAMAYRKDFFEAIGGFDEFFRVDYNDIDFCLRCIDRGYQVVFASQARLHHFHNSTFKRPHDDGKERAEFIRRWSHLIESDPFFPPEMLRLIDSISAQHSNEDVSV